MEQIIETFADEKVYFADLFLLETFRLNCFFSGENSDEPDKARSINKFLPSFEEIDDLIWKKISPPSEAHEDFRLMLDLEAYFRERCRVGWEAGQIFNMEKLIARLGLSEFGRSVAALALMAAIDGEFRTIFQYLQGDVDGYYPTLEFAAKVFFYQKRNTTLEYYREAEKQCAALSLLFPILAESKTPYGEQLIPDRRMLNLLLGESGGEDIAAPHGDSSAYDTDFTAPYTGRSASDTDFAAPHTDHPASDTDFAASKTGFVLPYLELHTPNPQTDLEPLFFLEDKLEQIKNFLQENSGALLYLYGEKGGGKKHLLRHYCSRENRGAVFCHLAYLSDNDENSAWDKKEALRIGLRISLREAVFQSVPLIITGFRGEEADTEKNIKYWKDLLLWLKKETAPRCPAVFLLSDREEPLSGEELFMLELPPPDEEQRRQLWEHYSKGDLLGEEVALSSLANTFAFTPGKILSALQTARLMRTKAGEPLNRETIYRACYGLIEHKLGEKAKRTISPFTWDDLKLAPEDKETLRDICNRVKNKHIVLSQWGFAAKLPYGGGLSAVFAGPPGTGKTMGAQVLANELNMELYRIDLSQIVDKYIGETEKNIRLIFDQAKKSNSILFFDEADSLFGKRVEAQSSNDRFANIESSLLLQCIEEYSGISLLATNNYSAIDPAFVRRFKYLIQFRMPDAGLRLEIWRSVFPAGVPLAEEMDFPWLAEQFALSGALIKNIALAAAFLAAEQQTKVEMIHIIRGLKREMIKEGRILEQAQLGSYGYLFRDL